MFVRSTTFLAVALISSSAVFAGAGLSFDGSGTSHEGGSFNFAVSSCSGVGMLTTGSFSGAESAGEPEIDPHQFDILSLFQSSRRTGMGMMGGGGMGGGRRPARADRGPSISEDGIATLQNMLAAIAAVSAAQEATDGGTAVNAGYCWCPPRQNEGNDEDNSGPNDDNNPNDENPDNDGDESSGPGGDDDDEGDGDDNPGGEQPNPSVVPEPGSLALWAAFGTLLLSATRRRES